MCLLKTLRIGCQSVHREESVFWNVTVMLFLTLLDEETVISFLRWMLFRSPNSLVLISSTMVSDPIPYIMLLVGEGVAFVWSTLDEREKV